MSEYERIAREAITALHWAGQVALATRLQRELESAVQN